LSALLAQAIFKEISLKNSNNTTHMKQVYFIEVKRNFLREREKSGQKKKMNNKE